MSEKTKTEQPAASDAEAVRTITFTENVMLDGRDPYADRFVRAGAPSPFRSIDEVPESLKALIATDEPEPEAPSTAFFQENVSYQLMSDGRMGRALRRQAGQLAAASAEREWAEEQVNLSNKLPQETLEAIQDQHDHFIARELAIAEYHKKVEDAAYESSQRKAAAGERPAPAFHVKRGAVYRKAEEVRLRPGETVYQQQASGDWWSVGLVDSTGALPPQEIII